MPKESFKAMIKATDGGGAYVDVPFDVEAVFGDKRPAVYATIDGHPYRGRLVRMCGPGHMLLTRKDVRKAIGKEAGDEVLITVSRDDAPRTVEAPEDLNRALGEAGLKDAFEKLCFTKRKEAVQGITTAKREDTRARRIAKVIEDLQPAEETEAK